MTKKRILHFLPVLLIMLVAIYCRYRFNFFQSTITGDGVYYPLQVRSILENFCLAIPDMPLYFYFTALVAKVLLLFNNSTPNETIILAVKIVDILIPVFSAVVVYFFIKQLKTKQDKYKFTDYLMIAFSVLALPYISMVSGELQKTAIGIVLIFSYLLLVYRYIEKKNLHIAKIAALLLLLAFIHFGSFTAVLLFTAILLILNIKAVVKWFKAQDLKLKIVFAVGIVILFAGIFLFDSDRFMRLLLIPLNIFNDSEILFWMYGNNSFGPIGVFAIIINILAIIALITVIKNKNKISNGTYRYFLSLIVFAFVLAFPLFYYQLFDRFLIYSFIPITIIYLMLFRLIDTRVLKYISVPIFLLLLLYSVRVGLVGHKKPNISREAYIELQTLKNKVSLKNNSVVIAGLRLYWWTAWEMKTHVSQDYAITESDIEKYDAFYFVRQITEKEKLGNNLLDMEVDIPSTANLIYKGENFEFYELLNKKDFKILPHKPPVVIGKISNITNNRFTISNGKLNYVVDYEGSLGNLKNGNIVKVWGALRPISTKIKAERIITYQTN